MKNETYEKAERIKRKIRTTEEVIERLKDEYAKPTITITAFGDPLAHKELAADLKIKGEDVPIFLNMLERWKDELENEFAEIQEEQNESLTVSPYEEYHNAGLSVICPYCETQIVIPNCDNIKTIECPACSKDINIKWANKEKKQ